MMYRFRLEGDAYSKNKSSFKKLLKRHNLQWKGTFGNFVWENERERVTAEFERDEEKDITLSATLVWEGRKKSELMEELKAWVWECGGSGGKEDEVRQKSSEIEKRIEDELEFWDSINKPDVEHLRATGRPKRWIENDLKEWRKNRKQKKRELLKRLRG